MWFEIIYWQPCNICFAYMPGMPTKEAQLPCMGVATQMSRASPMCPTPQWPRGVSHKKTHKTHPNQYWKVTV